MSVVIATHNRAGYAKKSIESILSIDVEEFQLIIHDTSDNNVLEEFCAEIQDARLKYIHCNELLSMTENFNRALEYVQGEYTIMIGDDDTILSTAIKYCRYAKEKKIDVISQKISAEYCWPDFRSKISGDFNASSLIVNKFTSNQVTYEGRKQYYEAVKNCFQGTASLPKLYHGIVKTSLLLKIKENTGTYFHGVSPDISIALSLAYNCERYIEVDYPITLPGSSGGSNAGRSAMRTHVGKLDDDPHMKRFKSYVWPNLLPRYFSVETVWAQAGLVTIQKIDNNKGFNFIKFYALCLIKHRPYKKFIIDEIKKYKKVNGGFNCIIYTKIIYHMSYFYINGISNLSKKIIKYVFKKLKSQEKQKNIKANDIFEARMIIEKELSKETFE
ncbi:glycosyltransferase family 2 protein [Escherichia coli]|uniref:glycosyltransferase family 2 protein n=1 Tax=Escherichia coli TaxID=562 RepID=UPI0021C124D2|nr:glycosyltransferase [Escherichia coli]